MERMFIDQVAPRLQVRMAEAGVPRAAVRTWHVYGMGESHIDHRLAGLLTGVEGATLHFRTSHPVNHVKVVVRGASVDEEKATLERIESELRKRIGPGIYAVDNDTFPAAVAKALKGQDPPATLAIAESCTGGLAGELVTSEGGASEFFRGSIVAYNDEVKTGVLGVKPETLADFGAVSEPAAREMAEGAKRVCGSTVAVAITGVAGPGGGTPDKPVGTVCFAVCGPGTTRTSTKLFAGNRERVRVAAAYYALDLARRYFDTRKR
jgi:nicotinamide-nucleotide amidase